MITHSELLSRLTYSSVTGIFAWKNGPRAGQTAGCDNGQGYVVIKLGKKRYRAHRLAWFYEFGEWPKETVDHKNRIRHANAIDNLRDVPNGVNNRNRSRSSQSGDVTFRRDRNRWRARLSLGSFLTRDEAVAECRRAIKILFPNN